MTPSNYDMAIECLRSAEIRSPGGSAPLTAQIEAMAAQTYATLALADAIREMQSGIRDTVAEEVSSALMDMKDSAHE